ncbi:MAG: DUF2339 domain-containing protein, partial [Alphaproteobacteria bacterium]|jgi:uncharacterized membrane protein|nr:DUF2339 domain-containing protein [Alphaproteobacteria bacterium]
VGEIPVLNALLLLYLLPAVLVGRLVDRALAPFRTTPAERARIGGVLALVLAFGWATLAVRQGFHAPRLFPGAVGTAELWAYSAVWLAFALAMFGAGLVLARRPLRAAGLAVMTLALAKAFLWDAAALDGLWRVASFLGLGIALLLIAWLFQRFVGTAERATTAAPAPD